MNRALTVSQKWQDYYCTLTVFSTWLCRRNLPTNPIVICAYIPSEHMRVQPTWSVPPVHHVLIVVWHPQIAAALFLICIYYFSCLILFARAANTIEIRAVTADGPALDPTTVFGLLKLRKMLAVGFWYMFQFCLSHKEPWVKVLFTRWHPWGGSVDF